MVLGQKTHIFGDLGSIYGKFGDFDTFEKWLKSPILGKKMAEKSKIHENSKNELNSALELDHAQ